MLGSARLLQLACICQHWRAAVGLVASRYRSVLLRCCCLTPAVSCWAARWTCLHLVLTGRVPLDNHGVPSGLTTFMQSCTALTQVSLTGSHMEGVDVESVQRALFAETQTVKALYCFTIRPVAFPVFLQALFIGPEVKWADRAMETMFKRHLQRLPRLRITHIKLAGTELMLSSQCLAGLVLPSLQHLKLQVLGFPPAMSFDLTWLSDVSRKFRLTLAMFTAGCNDGLLALSQRLQHVLQPQDDFILTGQDLCIDAQRVLSEVKLRNFGLVISWPSSSIEALPAADHIALLGQIGDASLQQATLSQEGHPNTPLHIGFAVHWSAVVCARNSILVVLKDHVRSSQARMYTTEMHVMGAPAAHGAASRPALSFENWGVVSGM